MPAVYLKINCSVAIIDATGTPLAAGMLEVQPVDATNEATPFRSGDMKQVFKGVIRRPISNGSLGQALQLSNPTHPLASPQNIGYTFTITDQDSGCKTVYPGVLIQDDGTGAWDMAKMLTGQYLKAVPITVVKGPEGQKGNEGVQGLPGPRGSDGQLDGTYISGTYNADSLNFVGAKNEVVFARPLLNNNLQEPMQLADNTQVYGYGRSRGNYGGWSVGKSLRLNYWTFIRGIFQPINVNFEGWSTGDKGLAYLYGSYVGGCTAPSDEGFTCLSTQGSEYVNFYHGTVTGTTGAGDVRPQISAGGLGGRPYYGNGAYSPFDGGILLNLSLDPGYACQMTGFSTNLENYINYLPYTSNKPLPTIRAWGVCTDGLYNSNVPDAVGTEVTMSVILKPLADGTTPALRNGLHRLAGYNFTEQVVLYNVQAPVNGRQQVTFKYRMPNGNFYLVDSDIADTYIVFDAKQQQGDSNGPYGFLSAYAVLGTLDGTRLLYIAQRTGGTGVHIPYGDSDGRAGGCDAAGYRKDINGNRPWTGFHLQYGAEVVGIPVPPKPANGNVPSIEIEPNRLIWATGHNIVCTHPPSGGGGNAHWLKHNPQTPVPPGFAHANTVISSTGLGVGGGYIFLAIQNGNNSAAQYFSAGGSVKKPGGVILTQNGTEGLFQFGYAMRSAPDPYAVDPEAYAFGVSEEGDNIQGRPWVYFKTPSGPVLYFLNSAANNPNGDYGGTDDQHYLQFPGVMAYLLRARYVTIASLLNVVGQMTLHDLVKISNTAHTQVQDGSGNWHNTLNGTVSYKDGNGNTAQLVVRDGRICVD